MVNTQDTKESNSQPAPVVPDGVRELLTEMVDIHRRRGVVLTIHIEQLAEILAAAPAQGQQVECQECERLRRSLDQAYANYNQVSFASTERGKERDRLGRELYERNNENYALRAELSALKAQQVGQEPVAEVTQHEPYEDGSPNPCKKLLWSLANCEDDLPVGTKLYTTPQPAPAQDVAGLWAIAMNAAAYLEDAANCMTDQEAKRAAIGAAEWVRTAIKAHDKQNGGEE